MHESDTVSAQPQLSETRLQSLLRVSSSLANALHLEAVYNTVISEGKQTLGARAGAVTRLQGETLTIVAFQGHDPTVIATLKQQPLSAAYPVAEAIRIKQPLFFHTANERLQRYPHLKDFFHPTTRASAYLPLLLNGKALGALTLSFPEEQAFDAATRAFLEMLTNTCAQALHRTLLFEQTKQSEERFRGLFEQTLDAIVLANSEGTISAVNASAEKLFGYSTSEFLSRKIFDLFDESERERFSSLKKQPQHYAEWLLRCKNGQQCWAEMSYHNLPDGHVQAVIRDITARKKAELERELLTRELETEKTILDTILRTAPVGFTFLNKDLRYSHTNDALATMNGVPAAHHLGRTLTEIVPDIAPKLEAVFRHVLETGENVSLDIAGETPKQPGETRYWHEDIYRVQTASGETLGLGVIVQDITERRRAERNAQLLLDLSASTRFLSNPDDIEYSVIRALGEHLAASNCTFAKVNLEERAISVALQWNQTGAKDLAGTYRLGDFVIPELLNDYQSGLTVALDDVGHDPRTAPYKANFAALGIGAIAVVPYLEEGLWTGTLTVTCAKPRHWHKAEIRLIEDILKQYYPLLQRLRTEAALRTSETQFRTLAETLPGFVWMDSEGGTNLYMNPRWEEFTGQSVEAARAGGWQEVTHPDDIPRIAQRWAWSRKTGEAYEMELRHRHKEGSYHWFLAKGLPVRDSQGHVTGWVGTSIDIQAQKETLEALQESETRFRELANGLPQFVWTLSDDKPTLEYINEPWLSYTGQTLGQALNNATAAIHPDDLPRSRSLWQRSLSETRPYECELRIRSKAGEYRWFLARTVPIKDETGQVKRWVGTSTDIHERKLAEFDASFLLMLNTRLGQLEGSKDIEETITRLLGEYLNTDRCYNGSFDPRQETFSVAFDWHKTGLASAVGSYRLSELTTPAFMERLSTGETLVIHDIYKDARTAPFADKFRFTQSHLLVPQLEKNTVSALFGVACTRPRVWQAHEVQLVEAVARQFWPALSRAKAEENLRASEARYRTLFTSIDEGFCVIEVLFDGEGKAYDYRFLEVNPMFEQQTGLKDALGNTARELVPRLEPHWFKIYGKVARTGESVRFVDESRAMDGRWFEVYASRVGDENSRKVAVVFNNVTERKRAELALRGSEEKLRMILESASEYAIFSLDLAGRVTTWNTGATKILGYEEADILGQSNSLLFTPEDRQKNIPRKEMQTALETGRAADDRWHVRKDGSRFWATGVMMPLRDGAGVLQGFLKIMRDRTRERSADEALAQSEARLSLTVQAGNLGIWDSDLLKKQTYWSAEQEKLFGLAPGEFDGGFSKHVHPEDRTRVLRKIAEVKATGETYQDEFRVLLPDGKVRWLAGRGQVLRNAQGEAVRLIGVNFDITERKQRELNSKFLLELNAKVRSLSAAADIEKAVIEALGSYLGLTNCNISYVDEAANKLEVRYNYTSGKTKLEGTYTLTDFVSPVFIRYYRAGEGVLIPDVQQDSRTKPYLGAISRLDLRALLVVPYLKEGRWVASLNLSCNTARDWRKDEQELAETVAAQFIPAIERAQSDETAALLAERFRLTEISAKSFLYEWDLPSNQVWRSQGLKAVTGFAPEEVPGEAQWWNARIHPEDFDRVQASGSTALARGGNYSTEYRVRHKDGHYLYLWDRGRVSLDGEGNAVKLLGTSTDVTAQKGLELQLAETAARLDATIAFLPLGFCLLSKDYRYIRINSVLASINGLSVEAHLGQKVSDILPFVWKMIEPILRQIETTGKPVLNMEVKHPREERTWLVSYYPVPDVDGGLLGFGAVALEITERQQALQALRESNVKLRDLTKRQQRFVADAAHELRAPLTSIRGNLDLLTRYQGIPEDEQQEMLQDLHQESVRLSRLVEDLLELARSDSGLKMNLQTVNLSTILLEAWDQIQQFDTRHTFELTELDQVFITGDADRLKQLALIFLENATKYTPEGGTISLGLTKGENAATFHVQDTGIGIAPEDLEHVFERFYRADKARTRAGDPGGTGLGLSIAEWIVTGHKGKVWLESDLGKGTTVFVELPLRFNPV
jgi:PAS domain S-box-containing protein